MRALPWIALALIAMTGVGLATNGAINAAAADKPKVPDMAGEWTGTSESVVLGSGGHHPGGSSLQDKPRLREVAFALSVAGQEGRRFWGTIKSPDFSEPFAAIFSTSNVYAYGADPDGFYHLKSLGPDQLELCYTQPATSPTGSIVAACTVFTRVKP